MLGLYKGVLFIMFHFQKKLLKQKFSANTLPILKYLEDLKEPDISTEEELNEWRGNVASGALKVKRTHILNHNENVSSRLRTRVPDVLSHEDVALVLAYTTPCRNIKVSTISSILGIYQYFGKKAGTYITSLDEIKAIIDPLAPSYTDKLIEEVMKKLQRMCDFAEPTNDINRIIVNNGIFYKDKKQLLSFDPQFVATSKIAVDYIPNAQNPVITMADGEKWDVDSWIKELADDDDTNTLLWQGIQSSIQPNSGKNKGLFLYSSKGNNGKGTWGQLIKNILGKENYSTLAIEDFKHEFLKESLLGVTANIADENDADSYLDSIRDFKASITGDDINVNRKFEKPIRLQFRGTNIQMINSLPKTKDKTGSYYRRFIIIPFLKSFTNNGERECIKQDYIHRSEVLQYVLYKALHLPNFDRYIEPAKSLELMATYKVSNNPVLQFWEELEEEFQWDLIPTQFLYDLFVGWFKRNNPQGKTMAKNTFLEHIKDIVEESPNWIDKTGQQSKVKTSKKMDADEPLITEYNLVNWMDPQAASKAPPQQRAFVRNPYYRGIVRV